MPVEHVPHRSPLRLVIAPSGQTVRVADVRRLMARVGAEKAWSAAAVRQLVRAAKAAERLLAEQPDQAARLFDDPAGTVRTMQDKGLLTGSMDDLLAALESLARRRSELAGARGRRVRTALRPASVSVGDRPALRFGEPGDGTARPARPATTCKPSSTTRKRR